MRKVLNKKFDILNKVDRIIRKDIGTDHSLLNELANIIVIYILPISNNISNLTLKGKLIWLLFWISVVIFSMLLFVIVLYGSIFITNFIK
jgi:hypothetical protein